MNIGIISTSEIALRAHVPALHALQDVTLWSVLSRDRDRALAFARQANCASPAPAYDDLDSFLADPLLDGVIVTSPDKLHAEHAIACAFAGKHVLVEKPLATEMNAGRRAIDVCRSQNVVLAVGYHLRWHPGHRELQRRLRQGSIGEIEHIRLLYSWQQADASNWRAHDEVGRWWAMAATGSHCLDLLRWFGDQSFVNVTKRHASIRSGKWTQNRDETAMLSYEYENGMTAQVTSSVLFDAPSRFEVFGSNGYAFCESTVGEEGTGRIELSGRAMEFVPSRPFEGEILDFVAAVREHRDPEVSGEVALEDVKELLLAAP